jgi:hypothetical protein
MWMFRWLQRLFAHRATATANDDPRWVEPSNAITRAILSGLVSELPRMGEPVAPAAPAVSDAVTSTPEPAVVEDSPAAERPVAQPATRTAQRSRRRRASRAA